MKDNKEFIDGVYRKYDEYLKERGNSKMDDKQFNVVENIKPKNFMQRNFVKILSSAAVFAVVISSVFIGKNFIGNENKPNPDNNQNVNNVGNIPQNPNEENTIKIGKTTTFEGISLNKVNNFDSFYEIIKENSKNNYGNYGYDYDEDIVFEESNSADQAVKSSSNNTASAQSEASLQGSTGDYSRTNIQVENVDEADVVKTNGKNIFYISQNKIIIVDIQDKSKMTEVTRLDFTKEDFKPRELFINNNKMIVIGNENSYSMSNQITKETFSSIYKKRIYRQNTTAVIYDISDASKPKEERKVKIEGNYVSSRMIGDSIYFIANKGISYYNITKTEKDKLNPDDYKPAYTDTLFGTEEKLINYDRIYYFNNIDTLNYLNLCGFNLNGQTEADVETFLGAGEDVYCSAQNLYVAKAKRVYDADTHMNFGEDTKILKFALNNGKIEFKAEATLEGGINNQFSMDEKDGYLRIATTIGKTYNMDNSTSNSLYVLDQDLKEVGRLDGIAKAEKIYSVRYVGNKAYMVTFREVDPLFVIDLSDVKNPKILGELKIPGYSTYLHPYDETHLIGFGYDTKDNGYGGVKNDGLKMAMFDVSDVSNPKELFNVKIGESGTNSPLTSNHKALLFSKEKNFIAFPVSAYAKTGTEYKAQVYDIDLSKGFTLRGEIQHKKEDLSSTSSRYTVMTIDRIIYSDNVFYTLSNKLIKGSDMNTLQGLSKLEI